ncbi:hypothetical protein LCGC14_2407990, partial [marine sediment metagenome]
MGEDSQPEEVRHSVTDRGADDTSASPATAGSDRPNAELKEEGRLNQLLLDSLPHPAMLIRADRTVLAANRIAREMGAMIEAPCWQTFGQSLYIPGEDKQHINDHDTVPPGGTHCTFCLADEALEQHQPTSNPKLWAFDRTWDTHWIPLTDDVYLHYAVDVTERKRAEEALRESEERHRTILDGTVEGILVADTETKRFVYTNPALCNMLGYSEKELAEMGVADIHPRESLKYVLSEFEAQASGEKSLASEIPCLRKDGTTIYADINTAPAMIDGRPCNVGFFTDVTERRLAEEALRLAHGKLLTVRE